MLEDLASAWTISQTGAVERAISEAHERVSNGEMDEAQRFQVRNASATRAIENVHPEAVREEAFAALDNRPKNAFCKHCGRRFAGPKFATICPECKGSGHTNTPAECPPCQDRGTGAL
jgi:Zn finger protein HypA/HybF involved in hydrogenase expression